MNYDSDRAAGAMNAWSEYTGYVAVNLPPKPQTDADLAGTPDTADALIREAVVKARQMGRYTMDDLSEQRIADRVVTFVLNYATARAVQLNDVRKRFDMAAVPVPKQKISLEAGCSIILGTGDVARLVNDDEDNPAPMLAVYHPKGDYAGVWTIVDAAYSARIREVLARLNVPRSYIKGGVDQLTDTAPIIRYSRHAMLNMYPLNDGVLEFDELGGREFTPYLDDNGDPNPDYEERYGREACFVCKSSASYRPGAPCPTFACSDGFAWNPYDHIRDSLSGNDAAITCILQSVLFGIRGMSGDRVFWFMDGTENGNGGGGKSTTAAMVAASVGMSNVAELSIDELATKEHYAGRIVGKLMILGDETSAGQKMIDTSDIIKRLMRGETITINDKYRTPYPYQFQGLWIQCMNTNPKFREKENALYRMVLPVYFNCTFTSGTHHPEIRKVFSKSQDTVDWLVNYALDTYGHVTEYDPDAVAKLRLRIADIRAASSTVYSFLDNYILDAANDDIPVGVLYRFYDQWCQNNGFARATSVQQFCQDAVQWTAMRGGWELQRFQNPCRKRSPWEMDRWITDFDIPNVTIRKPNGKCELTEAIVRYWKDRSFLVRNTTIAGSSPNPNLEAPEAPLVGNELALYQIFRASVASLPLDAPGLVPYQDVPGLLLSFGEWKRLGRLLPPWAFDGYREDAFTGWRTTSLDCDLACVNHYGYVRAVNAGRSDTSVMADARAFLKAAGAVS